MQVDYIILGQGLSGTLLSWQLMRSGKKVLVIDSMAQSTASRVASGVINPVTGKRMVKTWMIDELLSTAKEMYDKLGRELGVSLIQQCPIIDFFPTPDLRDLFAERAQSEPLYLSHNTSGSWKDYFRFNYGTGEINCCILLNISLLLKKWREEISMQSSLIGEIFDWRDCTVKESEVHYKGIIAQKIICCEGAKAANNPYFNLLPWSKDKGEALIVSIPGLLRHYIFKQHLAIVPWGDDDLFWVGATHDWKFTDLFPTPAFRKTAEEQLKYWLKLPFEVVDHVVAQRPTNFERKPFVGLHPKYPAVGILNGMGSKGCSLAPYFSHQLADHLISGSAIMPEVDIRRFSRILNR